MYPEVQLFIDGTWRPARSGKRIPVINPSTEEEIGSVAHAGIEDLDEALAAADKGFKIWRKTSAYERAKVLRKVADLLRQRADSIAMMLSLENGKPLDLAKMDTLQTADAVEWFAGECSRAYGRVIPARADGIYQLVVKEPVGPVAAFGPWNVPVNTIGKKICVALAAGCSVIAKSAEETPASAAEVVRAFGDAGVPAGAVNLVFGIPSQISEYLIPHPVIRKVSFTGSTVVGKQLAALAGKHMKRVTMELGGHSPCIVFDDIDVDAIAKMLTLTKFRNTGQGCITPTRVIVQDKIYDQFLERYVAHAKQVKVGDGLVPGSFMGPLANPRRLTAMEGFVADAVQHGATIATGGKRIGNKGYYYEPTILSNVPKTARCMNEEPFGPLALVNRFTEFEEAIEEANRLPYGLAAYAYTRSNKRATAVAAQVEAGMVSINHHGLALVETPFGGVKDSGIGSESGIEAMDAYMNHKFVTQASA